MIRNPAHKQRRPIQTAVAQSLPITPPERRKAEIRHRGRWCLTNDGIASIKAGDEFRMYEPDGTRVLTPGGSAIFHAVEDAVPMGDGTYGVVTEE